MMTSIQPVVANASASRSKLGNNKRKVDEADVYDECSRATQIAKRALEEKERRSAMGLKELHAENLSIGKKEKAVEEGFRAQENASFLFKELERVKNEHEKLKEEQGKKLEDTEKLLAEKSKLTETQKITITEQKAEIESLRNQMKSEKDKSHAELMEIVEISSKHRCRADEAIEELEEIRHERGDLERANRWYQDENKELKKIHKDVCADMAIAQQRMESYDPVGPFDEEAQSKKLRSQQPRGRVILNTPDRSITAPEKQPSAPSYQGFWLNVIGFR